jgi:hypothetical protein
MFKAPLIALAATAAAATLGFTMPAAAKTDDSKMTLTVEQRNGQTVYCLTENSRTGTRLPAKICQSRAEWTKEGVKFPEDRSAAGSSAETPKG